MQALNGRLVLSPSDLNDYVECPHLTTLALEVARGTRPRAYVPNEYGDLLRSKGEAHEAAYLERLRADGREIVDVVGGDKWDFEASARATREAMEAGRDVIYQATFVVDQWRGRADFQVCDERWKREDHLLLVAGIRRDNVTRLRAAGLGTLAALGGADATRKIPQVAPRTFETLHDQAALQLHRRTSGELTWHPLDSEP